MDARRDDGLITRLGRLLSKLRIETPDSQSTAQAENAPEYVREARGLLDEAERELEAGNYRDAYDLSRKAWDLLFDDYHGIERIEKKHGRPFEDLVNTEFDLKQIDYYISRHNEGVDEVAPERLEDAIRQRIHSRRKMADLLA